MNKKFFITWLVIFVAWMLGDFVVHAVLLHADYGTLPNLYRTETDSQNYLPFMLGAHVIMSGAFVWIYARGLDANAWLGQGVRFGIAVALLTAVPTYLIYYAVQPLPGMVVVKQIGFEVILTVILGIIVGFMYRNEQRAQ